MQSCTARKGSLNGKGASKDLHADAAKTKHGAAVKGSSQQKNSKKKKAVAVAVAAAAAASTAAAAA